MSTATKRYAIGLAVVAFLTMAWIGYRLYDLYMAPLVEQTSVVRLPTQGTQRHLIDSITAAKAVSDTAKLLRALERLDFSYRPGQFELREGMSAKQLVDMLQAGPQKEARVVLTHGRLLGDVARKAVRFVETDSAELHRAWLDSVWLDSIGLAPHSAISVAIPNTYNVYWNSSGEELRDRLYKECLRFWEREERLAQADSLGLSPTEVYTLASIVESETNNNAEKPRIAGVYLNRLRLGMKLDADPTVVFATGDFGLRRVLYEHLEIDSPYNTYMYGGLPPGPIAMASIASIDAVLNPEQHDYLFFVTKGDGSGTHAFATNMSGHARNIADFQQNLRERGIRR